MGLSKHTKMPVKTSCAMAAQQNAHLAQLLAQKQHFHMQLGCVQNKINEIRKMEIHGWTPIPYTSICALKQHR